MKEKVEQKNKKKSEVEKITIWRKTYWGIERSLGKKS